MQGKKYLYEQLEKKILTVGNILSIQQLDSNPCPLQQNFISRQNLRRCVAEIRQQCEVKMVIPVREMMNFQSREETINASHT